MNIEYKVKDLIKKYNTSNSKELVDHARINKALSEKRAVNVADALKARGISTDRMIVDSKGYIFVRSDLDCAYENFLIAHELGHYVLHYDENISFNFLRRVYKTRLEREANEFAIRLLMYEELHNIKELENIEFIVKEKGIPLKIWYSLSEKITID